jgi:uncharacterized protein with ParB-like and HNH nuclease domain
MKAQETHLGKILEGTNQFVVPLFQRPYTWNEGRWKVLWSDLVDLCEEETEGGQAKPHFHGLNRDGAYTLCPGGRLEVFAY